MDFKPKKNWIEPEVDSYGSDNQTTSNRPAMFGQSCGETVVRYGSQCGIRIGQECLPRIGQQCLSRIGYQCLPRIGPSCVARQGSPCATRLGTSCAPLPSEPRPPGQ